MLQYDYQENLTLEQINDLGDTGWQVDSILSFTSPNSFNVFLTKGFQDKTLVENTETGAKFWLNENVSYGDAFIIFVVMVFVIAIIGKAVYKFLFQQL